ncbi:MAG TPA: hypothetical protein VI636_21580 [Candidatus Angelobacter sp.]
MAKTHLTSGERLQVYAAVFRINRSFHFIVCRLIELRKFRRFNPKTLAELRAMTQEMQVEINHHLLERVTEVEHKDWHSFGKARASRNRSPKFKAQKR